MTADRLEAMASGIPVSGKVNIKHKLPKPLFEEGEVSEFQGEGNLYYIETYRTHNGSGFVKRVSESSYQDIPEFVGLVGLVRDLYEEVYPERSRKDPDLTTKRVLKSMSFPRTILMIAMHEQLPVGFGIFPRLDVRGEPVLYSSRGFVKEHEHHGLGTIFLERSIGQHRDESLRAHRSLTNGMLFSQNWYSLRSLEILKERGVIENIQSPIFDESYDEAGKHILYGIHSQVWVASASIEESGRSQGELRVVGPNEAATVPEEGTRAREIHDKMIFHPPYGLGINVGAGDVAFVRFTFPRSPLVLVAAE